MRSQEIQQALEKLKASSADIEATALVSQEGFIIASVLSENLHEERVADDGRFLHSQVSNS